MAYLQTTSPRQRASQPVSVFPAESISQKVQQIYSRVENLSASYLLQPFSVLLIEPRQSDIQGEKSRHVQHSKATSNNSFRVVIVLKSIFNQESLYDKANERATNNKISRNHVTTYAETIKHSGNRLDDSGTHWAEKQAALALKVITSSAKAFNLRTIVVKNEGGAVHKKDAHPAEIALTAYATVDIF